LAGLGRTCKSSAFGPSPVPFAQVQRIRAKSSTSGPSPVISAQVQDFWVKSRRLGPSPAALGQVQVFWAKSRHPGPSPLDLAFMSQKRTALSFNRSSVKCAPERNHHHHCTPPPPSCPKNVAIDLRFGFSRPKMETRARAAQMTRRGVLRE